MNRVMLYLAFIYFILDVVLATPQCSNIKISERFDCYPGIGASPDKCLLRGCCWGPAVNGQWKNVPYCFFPQNYSSYKVHHIGYYSNRIVARLTKDHLIYDEKSEFKEIQAEIVYETNYRLRLRITVPSDPKRWEPPIPLGKPEQIVGHELQYRVISDNLTFGLKVYGVFS